MNRNSSKNFMCRGQCLIALLLSLFSAGDLARAVDFERDVAPIFESHCLSCHDANVAKGDVRLDRRKHALETIAVGSPEGSSLIEQVSGTEPAMPLKGPPLSDDQVRILREWIKTGAPWPEARILHDNPPRDLAWWSLKPLDIVVPPSDSHPIDTLLNASLKQKGLTLAPSADDESLARRLHFDLTGLPPTPQEVHEFSNARYEEYVDKLLRSLAFGEKWARHWLDVARYAETHGYDKDKPRVNAWPYRDYVIRSLNDDKPYDRFVQEQIAGDALFPGDQDGVLALGFLAAGPWDLIGHSEVGEAKVDGRIAKHLDRDEMISAVFNVFTSTTVQCAQCHHHKFDPVRMEDYYRLHAVFAAIDRADRVYAGLSPAQEHEQSRLVKQVNDLKAEQDQLDKETSKAVAGRTSGIDRRIAALKAQYGSSLQPQYGWHSHVSKTQDVIKWVQVDLGAAKSVDQIHLIPAFDQFNGIGAGFGFPVRYKIEAADDEAFSVGVRLLKDATRADQPNPMNHEIVLDVGGDAVRYVRITATKLGLRKEDFIFALGEFEAIGGTEQENYARNAAVTSLDSIEQLPRWSQANLTDGIYHRELSDPAADSELRLLESERDAMIQEVRSPSVMKRLAEITEQLPKLVKQLAAYPQGQLVYAAASKFSSQGKFIATGGKPRPIHLLRRGDIQSLGDVMHPGMVPLWPTAHDEFTLPADASEAAVRAALAQAISSPDNPLLWRSIVNRLWQWTFGKPLVGTPNDFGRMGMQPTHPELLDFLAAKLRDDPKRSLKSIIRLLVTSQAYRRSSALNEANVAIDADNAFLWRMNRRRMTAEEFRDSLLWVSGKLQLTPRGGPSFQDFVIEKPQHSPHYEYHLHDPNDPASYRRSVYRFVVRSQPQPFLTALDCADPSISVAARDESTTALQALAQWNNRLVEAMSRHFGQRIEAHSGNKVDFAFRLATGRDPTEVERSALKEHFESHGAASLARVIFNLNAFVYLE